jgi:flagellar motor switch protein FliG
MVMPQLTTNLRKAAVFIRSLDAETATTLLAQLSSEEAKALHMAMCALGTVDPEEQADVAAEFRSARPVASEAASFGVELQLSSASAQSTSHESEPASTNSQSSKRFEFLDRAPIEALVPYLAREHAQTIAVVLSHLPPRRAADVLGALPEKLQAETIERLAVLGETDPESIVVLENELAAWLANRGRHSGGASQAAGAVANILAAADPLTRSEMVKNLRTRNAALANQLGPVGMRRNRRPPAAKTISDQAAACADRVARGNLDSPRRPAAQPTPLRSIPTARSAQQQPLPDLDFDELVRLDNRAMGAVLTEVDPHVLVLALAGSTDELVDRVCRQMPSRTARSFRRLLRKLGPTRLSDVESAQRAVAAVAARCLATAQSSRHATISQQHFMQTT